MLLLTLPGHIQQVGSVCLHHLGEAGWGWLGVSGGGAGRLAGFLFQPPHMRALTLGGLFGFRLVRLVCLGCHGIQFLIMSDFSPVGYDRGYIILQ